MSDDAEARIRDAFDRGDLDGAMTALIDRYGGELIGFLVGLARDRAHAEDVFGATCERMWKALPRFRWDNAIRVWAYTIARNEFLRSTRELNRVRQQVPLSESVRAAIAQVVTSAPQREAQAQARFAKIREQLDPNDHMLLGLRIDRDLSWPEIARVLAGDDETVDLERSAASLRKRYERLKAQLKKLVDEP